MGETKRNIDHSVVRKVCDGRERSCFLATMLGCSAKESSCKFARKSTRRPQLPSGIQQSMPRQEHVNANFLSPFFLMQQKTYAFIWAGMVPNRVGMPWFF